MTTVFYKVFDQYMAHLSQLVKIPGVVDDVVCGGYSPEQRIDDDGFVLWSVNFAFSTGEVIHRYHKDIGVGRIDSEDDLKSIISMDSENHSVKIVRMCDELELFYIDGFME